MAVRFFRQINIDIHTTLAIHPCLCQHMDPYVEKAYRGVIVVDKAYPLRLPLGMLDKFPKAVEPAVWWGFRQDDDDHRDGDGPKTEDMNGWSAKLERDLKEVSNLLKSCDIPEFVGLSHKVLEANRVVAVVAPLLTTHHYDHGRRISQTTVASTSSCPSYVIGISHKNDEKQLLHPLLQVEPLFVNIAGVQPMIVVPFALAWLLHCFDWRFPDGNMSQDLDMSEEFGFLSART
eukprot:Gb_28584 [translate_table: standard]